MNKRFFLPQLFSICIALISFEGLGQDTINYERPSRDSTISSHSPSIKGNIGVYDENYYKLRHVNRALGETPSEVNLQTPQATLENFILNSRNKEFNKAAYSLNLNLLPSSVSKKQVEKLARKLFMVINQNINLNWDELSDRPDGQTDEAMQGNKALIGKSRRSLEFGKLEIKDRDISLRLQRVKYGNESPYWLISANTVENIDALYAVYGPSNIGEIIPNWGWQSTIFEIPIWKAIGSLVSFIISFLLGWLILFLLRRVFSNSRHKWISGISFRLAFPAGLAVGILCFYFLLVNYISFNGFFANSFHTILLIASVGATTWFIMRFIDSFMRYLVKHRTGNIAGENSLKSRRRLTHLSVARRVFIFLIFVIGIAIILSQFESFVQVGISLFASAGVATIIIGIAAQSTLGNIIAGIQIAVTKPVQIGDNVIMNDNWGYVEDIGFVYMIVRTWDQRRLVVPLKRVISETFENWSMINSRQVRPIYLYADYRIEVQKVRDKFEDLLRNSNTWDKKKAPTVQVVEITEKTMKLSAYCSAKDPLTAWDLQCELREKLIAYIGELEDGLYLAKTRNTLDKTLEK
ncbi:Small-conductance mechanosensitive channel [Salegentibacter echinorum]|uniref:Small-conductance mechanosensitive channel n=1 Tax=Salegentibacter echinorum TaxID=1073325 RepID=A0A1M5CTJ9_SALEC|nr:mechanosensitive ion channel domain-containing protein [Salegentibacter echinorum]SHF58010.1 Small-conductance mechanosensitive channel [Salegentibacter echinorum]